MKRKLSILFLVFLLLGGGYFSYQAIKIDLKAQVAHILLKHAWQQSLKNGEGAPPWPSFDGRPIFKLEIAKHLTNFLLMILCTLILLRPLVVLYIHLYHQDFALSDLSMNHMSLYMVH